MIRCESRLESEAGLHQRLQLHHIQKTIILSLAHKAPLRFKDLQPPRVPNNTFSYHLKKLLDYGYIELGEGGYSLTRKSLKLLAFENNRKTATTPIFLTTIYVENNDGEVLLINRNQKPFQGWYGIPSGLIHYGERLEDAAKRELLEKTTIEATGPLKYCGVLDFRYLQQGTSDVFSHGIAFVYAYFYAKSRETVLDIETDYGQISWSKFGRSHILPEVDTMRQMVKAKTPQQISIEYEEPSHIELKTIT